MDYAKFVMGPKTLCRRVSSIPKKRLKTLKKLHGVRVMPCDCCGLSVAVAPSSLRQKKENDVPLLCDVCGAEVLKLSRGVIAVAFAPGAAEELMRAQMTPDDERLN